VHTLKYTWCLGTRELSDRVGAVGETETTKGNIHDWLEMDEGGPGFQFLTEK
jgi:hypothetical protein